MTNRILVIRFSSVGDIVLTEPVVRALRKAHPDAEISYLTKAKFLPLLDMFANLDHKYGWVEDRDSASLLDSLRQQQFDLVVDLHVSIRSARIRSALGVKSARAKKEWFKRIASVKLNAVAGKPSHALSTLHCRCRRWRNHGGATGAQDRQWWETTTSSLPEPRMQPSEHPNLSGLRLTAQYAIASASLQS
jgi:hypothetical protein